jgi:hypothetical protein
VDEVCKYAITASNENSFSLEDNIPVCYDITI